MVPSMGASRARVLSVLQETDESLAAAEVALRVHLHSNTARFHLDGLVAAGLVERSTEQRDVPGRPRTLYSAKAGSAPAGRRSYRLLAAILASYFSAQISKPDEAARKAGEAWGHYLVAQPAPFQRIDAVTATHQLIRTLDETGFAPEPITVGHEHQVLLRQCPFREAVADHSEVVCSVHLGLMRGVLAEIDAPLRVERLDAFVEPSLCVTHLASGKQETAEGWRDD